MIKNYPNYKIISAIREDEDIQWLGKPNKRCMTLEAIFNPLMPFALIWALVDFGAISIFLFTTKEFSICPFIPAFFLIHLTPVWIYLGGIFLTAKKYRNTEFAITNKAVYISGGIFSSNTERRNYTQFSNLDIHRGFFDNKLKVGDIRLTSVNEQVPNGRGLRVFSIFDIPDYEDVYNILMNNFRQTRINYEMYMRNHPVNLSGNIPYYQQELPDYPYDIQNSPYQQTENTFRKEQFPNNIPENKDDDERQIDW